MDVVGLTITCAISAYHH